MWAELPRTPTCSSKTPAYSWFWRLATGQLSDSAWPALSTAWWPGLPWIWRTEFALQHCFRRALVGEDCCNGASLASNWKAAFLRTIHWAWVCKAQLLVINFAQSSKGKFNWITLVASVYQEKRCGRSISRHIPLPIYSPNLIITNRVWLKHQENTFMSLVCNLEMSTEKLELLCFLGFFACVLKVSDTVSYLRHGVLGRDWEVSLVACAGKQMWCRLKQQHRAVRRFTNVNACWFLATYVHLFPHPT